MNLLPVTWQFTPCHVTIYSRADDEFTQAHCSSRDELLELHAPRCRSGGAAKRNVLWMTEESNWALQPPSPHTSHLHSIICSPSCLLPAVRRTSICSSLSSFPCQSPLRRWVLLLFVGNVHNLFPSLVALLEVGESVFLKNFSRYFDSNKEINERCASIVQARPNEKFRMNERCKISWLLKT